MWIFLFRIDIRQDFLVESVEKETTQFIIKSSNEIIKADKVIIATGSAASPKTGSDGIGYKLLKRLSHTVIEPKPALVQLKTTGNFLKDWSGIRTDVKVSLYENDIVNLVSDEDHTELSEGKIPESLWDAVRYFIVASAIKCKYATKPKERFSDMIVHAFREVLQHSSIYTSIESYISCLKNSFEYEDEDMEGYLKDFEKCFIKYVSDNIKANLSFKDIEPELITVVRKTKVILKNGIGKTTQGNEKLKWHKIYIGGDLLQRGLTFSNLITTYFTRWATSGGNMDTNLQRARWFGYRSKYFDLCKIFTTSEIAQEFTNLAEIEDDLWEQFADVENGVLSIDDILIQSENTKQSPTSKQRVNYEKVSFKNRWLKQRFLVTDESKISENDSKIKALIDSVEWEDTTAGSKIGAKTAQYAYFDSKILKDLINVIYGVFDCEPFQKKALTDLLGQTNIPVILMGADKEPRKRSIYKADFRIKALLQGADSTISEKVTYVGDSGVVIDKDCVNIQIHRILPREDKTTVMKEKEQYMFAIYIPKEKTYFVKGN